LRDYWKYVTGGLDSGLGEMVGQLIAGLGSCDRGTSVLVLRARHGVTRIIR
jgi:hypothetical protein